MKSLGQCYVDCCIMLSADLFVEGIRFLMWCAAQYDVGRNVCCLFQIFLHEWLLFQAFSLASFMHSERFIEKINRHGMPSNLSRLNNICCLFTVSSTHIREREREWGGGGGGLLKFSPLWFKKPLLALQNIKVWSKRCFVTLSRDTTLCCLLTCL